MADLFHRLGIVLFFTIFSCTALEAQYTNHLSDSELLYRDGVQLYEQGQWTASFRTLERYSGVLNKENKDFYLAANAYEMRRKDAMHRIQSCLKQQPYSLYASELHFMQGVLLLEKNKRRQAIKEFDKVEAKDLSRVHEADYLFYEGYTHLQNKDYLKASSDFSRLKQMKTRYNLQARYYYAYCQYSVGKYDKALPDFLAIEHTAQYQNIVPYYIIQIYYNKGEYDEVYERAEYLLSNAPDNEYNGELHRILGEIYFSEDEYRKSAENLDEYQRLYTAQKKDIIREDIYLLGIDYYQLQEWQKAIDSFDKIKKENDLITQNSCFLAGNSYIQLTQPQQAQLAYAAASRYTFNDSIREQAMFNYALTTYQSSTALGESVTAFTDFLEQYPQSPYREDAIELLCDVFLNSKNYQFALQALNDIDNPNQKMLQTKQYLRYQIASDAYIQGNNPVAVKYFSAVIDSAFIEPSSPILTDSYFWRAETYYRQGQYSDAITDLNSYEHMSNAKENGNYKQLHYSKGYGYFAQKDYNSAREEFLKYADVADKSSATYSDALNRIGDCYFNDRQFSTAEGYYAKVIALGSTGADYATFQRGYALGLLKRYSDKITVLDNLVKQYPKSDYADDALYEIARAELQRNDNQAAIAAYERLLQTYPNSPIARKAALEKGMIYYNEKDYAKAIETYKQVIKNYPGSDEAYAALDGLEAAYIETDNISEYLAYTKSLGKINMKTNMEEDSLTYITAERQYMLGNYPQAVAGLAKYQSQFCEGGRYCTTAQYYLADSYYQLQQKSEALEEYKKLVAISGNPYMEEATTRAAEITYDQRDFRSSLQYFKLLQTISSTLDKVNMSRLGILRCSYYLNDHQTTIDVASEIITEDNSSAEILSEARYNRAKAYFDTQRYTEALADLDIISVEARTAQGAEANYLKAQALFNLNEDEKAEKQIMSFAQMNTAHQYWLAKCFLLLSDIYVKRGDDFQAKQYLLSLQQNYHQNDDIETSLNDRLKNIYEREVANQEKTDDNDED